MPYRAQEVRVSSEELGDLTAQVNREFDQVERGFNDGVRLPQRNAEPARPRDGMIEYADGVNWDPGQGEGVYAYFNGMWNKLASGTYTSTRSLQIVLLDVAPISTGIKLDFFFDYDCIIQRYTILADQSTTTTVDLWVDTFANYPPTDADSITAAAPIALSTADKAQDATLTGWTTAISRGDTLRINVDANDNALRLTIALEVLVS